MGGIRALRVFEYAKFVLGILSKEVVGHLCEPAIDEFDERLEEGLQTTYSQSVTRITIGSRSLSLPRAL